MEQPINQDPRMIGQPINTTQQHLQNMISTSEKMNMSVPPDYGTNEKVRRKRFRQYRKAALSNLQSEDNDRDAMAGVPPENFDMDAAHGVSHMVVPPVPPSATDSEYMTWAQTHPLRIESRPPEVAEAQALLEYLVRFSGRIRSWVQENTPAVASDSNYRMHTNRIDLAQVQTEKTLESAIVASKIAADNRTKDPQLYIQIHMSLTAISAQIYNLFFFVCWNAFYSDGRSGAYDNNVLVFATELYRNLRPDSIGRTISLLFPGPVSNIHALAQYNTALVASADLAQRQGDIDVLLGRLPSDTEIFDSNPGAPTVLDTVQQRISPETAAAIGNILGECEAIELERAHTTHYNMFLKDQDKSRV